MTLPDLPHVPASLVFEATTLINLTRKGTEHHPTPLPFRSVVLVILCRGEIVSCFGGAFERVLEVGQNQFMDWFDSLEWRCNSPQP